MKTRPFNLTFKCGLPLAFLLLCSFFTSAQKHGQQLIDSLRQAIPFAKNDTIKARLYKSISEQYLLINPDEAMQFAQIGLKHVTGMNWGKGIAVFTSITGQLYSDKGEYKKAIQLYENALEIHQKNKDYNNSASCLNNIGAAYQRQSMFSNAIDYFLKSIEAAKQVNNNSLIALGYSNIGIVYSEQNNTAKALEYQNKALKIQEKENNPDDMANTLSRIANEYVLLKDTAKATRFFLTAKQHYLQSENNPGLARVLTNYSILLTDYRKSLELKLQAQKIWDEVGPEDPISIANIGNIGLAYFDIVRYDTLHKVKAGGIIPAGRTELLAKAEAYLKRAIDLSRQTGNTANYAHFSGNLSELQELNKDYKNSLFNFKTFYHLNDSLYSQESKNKIAAIESQREIDIRNKDIENKQLQLANQHKTLLLLMAALSFLAIVGGLLFYQNYTRKKTNTTLLHLNSEPDEANKIKARFFAILSHDLRSPVANLVNFLRLQKRDPTLLTEQQAQDQEKKIAASAESLLETMEAMLLWSKGQMENFQPSIEKLEVNDLFNYIHQFFTSTENVQFIFSNPQNLVVNADANYLQTIMHNLTSNAVKALKNTSGATIEWKAFQQKDKTILSITDNGPGVEQEMIQALYKETTSANSKTGLGLHLIRDLAKAIQCSITAESNPGKGTTFYLFS